MAAEPARRMLDEAWSEEHPEARRAPSRERPVSGRRAGLLAAFQDLGRAEDEKTAYPRTKDWYRCGGAEWTRSLG